jgi:hypothetical protein
VEERKTPLSMLSPEEIEKVKSAIATLLNYTRQGGAPVKLPEEVKKKLSPEAKEYVKSQIAHLLS